MELFMHVCDANVIWHFEWHVNNSTEQPVNQKLVWQQLNNKVYEMFLV